MQTCKTLGEKTKQTNKPNIINKKPCNASKPSNRDILLLFSLSLPVLPPSLLFPSSTIDIDKKKYLVPADLTVGQFVYVVRKRIKMSSEKAIFIFINGVLPPTAALMSSIYEQQQDEDGFLYITYR